MDCWNGHLTSDFADLLKAHPYVKVCHIPAGCTSKAQPCDCGLHKPFKDHLAASFREWQLHQPRGQKLDFSLTKMRNVSFQWEFAAWTYLKDRPEMVKAAWRKAGFSKLEDVSLEGDAICLLCFS